MSLRLGRIAYLNVVPYFHFLPESGFRGEVIDGVPADLNRMLAAGEIDACPSSSFEYGMHADDYLLLPGHSISSVGPVHSVLLFCPGQLAGLRHGRIALTGESATSVNLLRLLLHEFCGVDHFSAQIPAMPIEDVIAAGGTALLIGDRALAAAKRFAGETNLIDLGALWYHFTGLPFVFALWILRRDAVDAHRPEFNLLGRQLAAARSKAFAYLEDVAAQWSGTAGLTGTEMVRYWRAMSYELDPAHQEGLRLYFALCEKHGLLPKAPRLEFFQPDG